MKRLIAILCFYTLAVYSHVAFAATSSPGAGWKAGLSSTGQTIWFGPAYATKTSAQMGQAIWESAVGSGTGAKLTTTAKLAVGAGEAAVVAKGLVTGANVFAAVKLLAMGGTGVAGIGITALTMAPMVMDYFTSEKVRLGPLSKRGTDQPFEVSIEVPCPSGVTCILTEYFVRNYGTSWVYDLDTAVQQAFTEFKRINPTYTYQNLGCYSGGQNVLICPYKEIYPTVGGSTPEPGESSLIVDTRSKDNPNSGALEWLPASMDDIAPYMDKPITPPQIQALLDAGATFPITTPSVSGPAVVTAPPVISTTNDGTNTTTTTKTTKSTQTYSTGSSESGQPAVPKVTSTTNTITVTNVVNNSTGATTTTTNTTNNPGTPPTPTEETKDQCQENPDSLACSQLDTPDGEIPKSNKEISYTAQNPFGGGSCPSDKYQTLHTGQTLKVVDWATPCGYIAVYVRPVLILLGSWIAMMLLIPGRTES